MGTIMNIPELKASGRTIGGFNPQHLSESRGFDGKRIRKAIQRRTVDYNSDILRAFETKLMARSYKDYLAIQPESTFVINYLPPSMYLHNPVSSVTTKFIHTSTNKVRCPINTLSWTPEGRRLITGASSGEFTLWNGMTFNFETILQAHDTAIRCMRWSHNDTWMISGEDSGIIKYWQSNMNNLKIVQAHKETVRDLTFSPTDTKFASCSDDGTIKIWSFADAKEERVLTGHGWDVKCLAWHPTQGLLASGSKDNLAKIWDPKTGKALATLHGHKNTIMQCQWNKNGNWLLTACRDQLIRLYDIRTMKEMHVFRGHKREVLSWHPIHENMFVSGGWEGSMHFWLVGDTNPVSSIESAHVTSVFALDWHPMGHILASGSNDHTTRFWTRNRPGDPMNDAMNLSKDEAKEMGIEHEDEADEMDLPNPTNNNEALPGLGLNRPRNQGSMGHGREERRGNDRNDRSDRNDRNDRNRNDRNDQNRSYQNDRNDQNRSYHNDRTDRNRTHQNDRGHRDNRGRDRDRDRDRRW